jgi:hypothetical protein
MHSSTRYNVVQLQEQGFAVEKNEQMNKLLLLRSCCSSCYVVVDKNDSTHDMTFGDHVK